MKVALGSDHGGFELKKLVFEDLLALGHEVNDQGTDSLDSVDYPMFARNVCELVAGGECDRGILICGTGIGMSMSANRNKKIRAALCHELYTARLSRQHNDANILCLGARVIGPGLAIEIVRTWLLTDFNYGRHLKRLEMF
ncbi:MAG: ribose 5-phosphate isomerase B [Thermodesulfobacteriota bacterium]